MTSLKQVQVTKGSKPGRSPEIKAFADAAAATRKASKSARAELASAEPAPDPRPSRLAAVAAKPVQPADTFAGPRCLIAVKTTHTAIEYNRDQRRAFLVVMDQPIVVETVPLDDFSARWKPLDPDKCRGVAAAAATYLFSHTPKTQRAFDHLKEIYMQDLSKLKLPQLTKLYNQHAKVPVKAFPSEEAARRACELLLGEAMAEPPETPTTPEAPAAAEAPVSKPAAKSKSTTKSKGATVPTMKSKSQKTKSKKEAAKKPAAAPKKPSKAAKATKPDKTAAAAKAGAAVKPKVVGAKKAATAKAPGVGSKIRELILANKLTDEAICAAVVKEFKSNTTTKNVAWYRADLRRELGANKVPAPVKAK